MRGRTDVARSHGGSRGGIEDPGDPIGLGEQGAVDGAETDSDTEALQHAGRRGRRGEQHEGVEVADQHARQQDHGQLATGRPHHRCVPVLEEQAGHRQGRHDPQGGDHRRRDGEGAAPPDEVGSGQRRGGTVRFACAFIS